jgi:hypothetical protein
MKKIIIILSIFTILMSPAFVYAQTKSTGSKDTTTTRTEGGKESPAVMSTLTNPLKGVDSIGDLFYKIVDFVMSLSYVVIAFFLLLSGFKFVTAQGSDEKLTEAKHTFYYTIIGALILIGANTIIKVIQSVITGLQG